MAEYMRCRGFRAHVLQTGKPAAPWVRRQQPDLILLDLMLPDVSGFDVCTELKLDRATNLIPLVMVTALVEQEDRVRGLEVGANYYVTKPFTQDELNAAIDAVLAWRDEVEPR